MNSTKQKLNINSLRFLLANLYCKSQREGEESAILNLERNLKEKLIK